MGVYYLSTLSVLMYIASIHDVMIMRVHVGRESWYFPFECVRSKHHNFRACSTLWEKNIMKSWVPRFIFHFLLVYRQDRQPG
jgi:hypothetical protein